MSSKTRDLEGLVDAGQLSDHAVAGVLSALAEAPDFSSAASFLLGLGHRRLAALGPRHGTDRRDTRGEARLQGFAETLRAASAVFSGGPSACTMKTPTSVGV